MNNVFEHIPPRPISSEFEKFYKAKKYKDVEIVFSIPKAKSGSISIKIRQPSLWTDPYLPDLSYNPLCQFVSIVARLGIQYPNEQQLI